MNTCFDFQYQCRACDFQTIITSAGTCVTFVEIMAIWARRISFFAADLSAFPIEDPPSNPVQPTSPCCLHLHAVSTGCLDKTWRKERGLLWFVSTFCSRLFLGFWKVSRVSGSLATIYNPYQGGYTVWQRHRVDESTLYAMYTLVCIHIFKYAYISTCEYTSMSISIGKRLLSEKGFTSKLRLFKSLLYSKQQHFWRRQARFPICHHQSNKIFASSTCENMFGHHWKIA